MAVRRKRRNLSQPCSQAVSGVISDVIDCKTVGFFLKIGKEIGNAWRKSLMRANRASLTRPYSVRGRRLKGKGKGVFGKGVLGARETRGAPFPFPFERLPRRLTPVGRVRRERKNVSPQSRSLFSASFHTFCVTARVYLNTQKYGLFCSLVMSKLDYGCVVFSPLPEYQMKWPQRVQTTCAGYLLGRYAVLEDLQKLNWLPIIKRRDLALLKITHKSLCDDVWPDYLRLKFRTVSAYNFEAQKLSIPTESGTFQDSTARFFSTLPDRLSQEPR